MVRDGAWRLLLTTRVVFPGPLLHPLVVVSAREKRVSNHEARQRSAWQLAETVAETLTAVIPGHRASGEPWIHATMDDARWIPDAALRAVQE